MTAARLMTRPGLIFAALATAAPAVADTVRCKAVDGRPTVTLEVTITGEAREEVTVTRLDADLGDFTISTSGKPPGAHCRAGERGRAAVGRAYRSRRHLDRAPAAARPRHGIPPAPGRRDR